MQARAVSKVSPDAGPHALRHALMRAFARPGNGPDVSLRDLAVLLVTVQRPGQDPATLAAATGLKAADISGTVDGLRRQGLLESAGSANPQAIFASSRGAQVVQAMAAGFRDAPVAVPPPLRATARVLQGAWPRSDGF